MMVVRDSKKRLSQNDFSESYEAALFFSTNPENETDYSQKTAHKIGRAGFPCKKCTVFFLRLLASLWVNFLPLTKNLY